MNRFTDNKIPLGELQNQAKNWFWDKVYIWRCIASLIWSVLMQWIFLKTAVCFVSLFIFHNLNDSEAFSSVLCISSFQHYFVVLLINVLISIIHIKHYTVKSEIHLTRLKQIISNINPKRALHIIIHGLAGAVTASIFMKLIRVDYSNFIEFCEEKSGICYYNEKHLFIILHGMYVGVIYSIKYFVQHWNYVEFPTIQELKIHIIKIKLFDLFRKSSFSPVKSIQWFYISYYFGGSLMKQWITNTVGFYCSKNIPLTTVIGLLNLELFIVCWIVNSLIQLEWKTFIYLFQIFVTQRHIFLIEAVTPEDKKKSLLLGLKCNSFPLFQYLSYIDLSMLAKQSPERRKQIFSISQPGGHPYYWDAISSECLSQVKSFLCSLNEISGNVCNRSYTNGKTEMGTLDNRLNLLSLNLRNNHFIKYLTTELPDAKTRNLYASCRPLIWSIEALCYFISASYKEDEYGVVQKLLATVLSQLFELQMVMEGQQRGGMMQKRYQKDIQPLKEMHLRENLKTVLTNGIYHIVQTFNNHLHALPLSTEHQHHLNQYLLFME